jgi:Uma2 family endonuclease
MFLLVAQPKRLQRRPDLAFVSFDRWPRDREVLSTEAWDVIPNLAVEIVSPTNGANEVVEKIEDYFNAGVERVWVVYPSVQKLYDYRSANSVEILTRTQAIEGGKVLPGFRLSLADVFKVTANSEERPRQ